jgi:thiol-disulfide isomerase/thioredoxin
MQFLDFLIILKTALLKFFIMKKIFSLNVFVFLCLISYCQGIIFEKEISWKEVQDKAKAENKYIFIDCYATWCGPCKMMKENVFNLKEVGDFFNKNFISVEVQMNKTMADSQKILDWYSDAAWFSSKYVIKGFPTYMFFSPDGIAVHRLEGATLNWQRFLEKSRNALDSNKQYYSIIPKWQNNQNDSTLIINTLTAALDAGDEKLVSTIAPIYFKRTNNTLSRAGIQLMSKNVNSHTDDLFKLFLKEAHKINVIMKDTSFVERVLAPIICKEIIIPAIDKDEVIDWDVIVKKLKYEYPSLGSDLIFQASEIIENKLGSEIKNIISVDQSLDKDWTKVQKKIEAKFINYNSNKVLTQYKIKYYAEKSLWKECGQSIYIFLNNYLNDLVDDDYLNGICWYFVFLHNSDMKVLKEAANCMKDVVKRNPVQLNYLDTYANILYKIGKREEAIILEKIAISQSEKNNISPRDLGEFTNTLKKMEKGEKTWID